MNLGQNNGIILCDTKWQTKPFKQDFAVNREKFSCEKHVREKTFSILSHDNLSHFPKSEHFSQMQESCSTLSAIRMSILGHKFCTWDAGKIQAWLSQRLDQIFISKCLMTHPSLCFSSSQIRANCANVQQSNEERGLIHARWKVLCTLWRGWLWGSIFAPKMGSDLWKDLWEGDLFCCWLVGGCKVCSLSNGHSQFQSHDSRRLLSFSVPLWWRKAFCCTVHQDRKEWQLHTMHFPTSATKLLPPLVLFSWHTSLSCCRCHCILRSWRRCRRTGKSNSHVIWPFWTFCQGSKKAQDQGMSQLCFWTQEQGQDVSSHHGRFHGSPQGSSTGIVQQIVFFFSCCHDRNGGKVGEWNLLSHSRFGNDCNKCWWIVKCVGCLFVLFGWPQWWNARNFPWVLLRWHIKWHKCQCICATCAVQPCLPLWMIAVVTCLIHAFVLRKCCPWVRLWRNKETVTTLVLHQHKIA